MVKGLVLFDYDGTLVDEREYIYIPSERTHKAIKALQMRDYLCVLATGRATCYLPTPVKELNLDGYITCNGGYVVVKDEILYSDCWDNNELKQICAQLEALQANYFLEGQQNCFVKNLKDDQYKHFIKNFKVPDQNFIAWEQFDYKDHDIVKITIILKNESQLKACIKLFEKTYDCSIHRNCNSFDIVNRSNSKGNGAKHIQDRYHLHKDQCYAFGDGDNDVSLLKSVTYAIAMKEHHASLTPIAYMVCESVKEEGIYKALKKLEVI